jgi:hypothetical protein
MDLPGIQKKAARTVVGVNTASADVAADFMQAAFNPTPGQQALQAGGAAGTAAVLPASEVIAFMTDMRTDLRNDKLDMRNDMQTINTNVVAFGNKVLKVQHFLKKIDTHVNEVDTRVTVVNNRVTAWRAASKRDNKDLVAALQAMAAEQAQKDAARDAEIERLKQAKAATDAEIETLKQKEAARKEVEDNMLVPFAIDVVPPRDNMELGEKRKRDMPVRYAHELQVKPKPKPKPRRDPVADKATYDYAMQHWEEMVFTTGKEEDFVWLTDMNKELQKKGMPGDLTIPKLKRLVLHFNKVTSETITWQPEPDMKGYEGVGFRKIVLMSAAEHAQLLAGL